MYVRGVGDKGRIPKIRPLTCEAAGELECDRQRLANVVESCDFQFRKVKTFAKHVNANHNPGLATDDLLANLLAALDGLDSGVQLNRIKLGILAVNLIDGFRAADILDAGHEDVALVTVKAQALNGFFSNHPVHKFRVELDDGLKLDWGESSLPAAPVLGDI